MSLLSFQLKNRLNKIAAKTQIQYFYFTYPENSLKDHINLLN